MLKIFLFVIYFLQYVNAEEYEYYYDENEVTSQESESETPKDLISFLMEGIRNKKDSETKNPDSLMEKLFLDSSSGLGANPVFNWIVTFSAIALFFQAFYTPFGKTSIGRKRRSDPSYASRMTK